MALYNIQWIQWIQWIQTIRALDTYWARCPLRATGPEQQREYAVDYMDLMLGQRFHSDYVSQIRKDGNVAVSRPRDRKDCTLVHMPDDCVSYIVGKQWETVRKLENALGVMIFDLSERRTADQTSVGILGPQRREADQTSFGIFGPTRSRCGVELIMQALVEHTKPGFFSEMMRKKIS